MALKVKTHIAAIFTVSGVPEKARFAEVLPGLKKVKWHKLPNIKAIESAHADLSRHPGGNMLYILPKNRLGELYRGWLGHMLEIGSTVILTEGDTLHLHHRNLGLETDTATLFTKGKGTPFLLTELLED